MEVVRHLQMVEVLVTVIVQEMLPLGCWELGSEQKLLFGRSEEYYERLQENP